MTPAERTLMERPSKVSCLMVTSYEPARRDFLARSVESYYRQTYENRELLIVSDCGPDDRAHLAQMVDRLGREDVSCVLLEDRRTLGALRNASVQRASGEIICQWDDDDLYHPERIASQVAPLLDGRAQASLLAGHFSYFQEERRMLAVDWRVGLVKGHAGTLMRRRDIGVSYPEEGRSSSKSEDASLLHQMLRQRVPISLVEDSPYLYVYRFHGGNTWDRAHHMSLASRYGVPRAALLADAERLSAALRAMFLEQDEIQVEGREGPAVSVQLDPSRSLPIPGGGTMPLATWPAAVIH